MRPSLSVIDNVLTGRLGYMGNLRSLFRVYSKEDIGKAVALLDRVGLIGGCSTPMETLLEVKERAEALAG